MPAIPATSWTQASSSGSITPSGLDIRSALLSEKPATASVVNASAPSKQTVFAGLAIGLGAITLVIILSLILLRLKKRDTKTSKVKGLKPLLLGTPAARTFDLEKGSSLTLKSSERRLSQAKVNSSPPIMAATSSEIPSDSLDCTIPTHCSPVPSIDDELFTISSEYQSWFFGDHSEVEQGFDLIPDTSVTLGDVDGGPSASLAADILPQPSECTADCQTMVHSDDAQASSYGCGPARVPELKVNVTDTLAAQQSAEQTFKRDSRRFDLITSSDLSPCMPSKQTFSEAALTTKIDTYTLDSTPESSPVLNSEVLSAPETAVSVETGTLEDTGSKALVTHNGRLGFTSSEYIDGSSFIASIPGSSPDRPAYIKDTRKNHPSITGSPASASKDISGLIQDYADNFSENGEKELVERTEEINIGIIARSSAQDSSTSKRTQGNAQSPVRRYSIGPPPSCPLPPLPPTKPIVSKTDVVETGPKHRTQAPAKSILKKPHSDQRTPSAVTSLSGTGKKPRGRHARLPSEDLLEKLARYAKVKSKDALYKPMRVIAMEAAARDLSPSAEGTPSPSPVEVNIRSVDAHRRPLTSSSQPTSTKTTDTPSKARFTGKVLTASRADQENTVPPSEPKSSGKRRKLFGSIAYSRSRAFVP